MGLRVNGRLKQKRLHIPLKTRAQTQVQDVFRLRTAWDPLFPGTPSRYPGTGGLPQPLPIPWKSARSLPPWPAAAAPPSLTQEGRLGVGPGVSSSGDGPPRWPLPGLSREQDLPEEQQKAAHQHLFHVQEEDDGQGCNRHDRRRGQVRCPRLPELQVRQRLPLLLTFRATCT